MEPKDQIDDGTVKIHGKTYLTTARRVKDFRAQHPELSLSRATSPRWRPDQITPGVAK